jgi:hypothetical protein
VCGVVWPVRDCLFARWTCAQPSRPLDLAAGVNLFIVKSLRNFLPASERPGSGFSVDHTARLPACACVQPVGTRLDWTEPAALGEVLFRIGPLERANSRRSQSASRPVGRRRRA